MFAQWQNHLTTYFSEHVPIVKQAWLCPPRLLYRFIRWQAFRLFPYLGCCEWCFSKHGGADISSISSVHFLWVYIQKGNRWMLPSRCCFCPRHVLLPLHLRNRTRTLLCTRQHSNQTEPSSQGYTSFLINGETDILLLWIRRPNIVKK